MTIELASVAHLPVERQQIVLRGFVEAVIVANWNFIISHHGFPTLSDFLSRARSTSAISSHEPRTHRVENVRGSSLPTFKVRPTSFKLWQDIPQIMALGTGDAKDFACWRIAELRNQGVDDVYPYIKRLEPDDGSGPVWSVLVRNSDTVEDPCVGMDRVS